MRLDVDAKLAKQLQSIKSSNPSIGGKGFVRTLEYLVNHHAQTSSVKDIILELKQHNTRFIADLPDLLRQQCSAALLFAAGDVLKQLFENAATRPIRADVDRHGRARKGPNATYQGSAPSRSPRRHGPNNGGCEE